MWDIKAIFVESHHGRRVEGFRDGRWQQSIHNVGLQGMACHVLRDNLRLDNLASGPLELCLHGRRYHSYFLEHMIKYMKAHAPSSAPLADHERLHGSQRPVFYTLQLNEGQDPSMKRVRSLDEDLRDSLKQLLEAHPNTVLVLTSTQGVSNGKYYETSESGMFENAFPLLHIALPRSSMLDKDPKLEEAVMSNSNGWKISTHVDLYHTLIDLLTYPSHYHPKPFKATRKGITACESIMVTPISLLRQRYLVHRTARRSCLSAGVAFEFCACIQWKGTSRKMEGLAEYALSQVNKDMWLRNKASFSGCQPCA